MQEKYGFVYIWRDRKHKRFYIGAHWGTEDDGYICSSTWMRNSYRRRPQDFKRRILFRCESKNNVWDKEYEWLKLISQPDLGRKYYNYRIFRYEGLETQILSDQTKEKMRLSKLGTVLSQKHKDNICNNHASKIPGYIHHSLGSHHSEITIEKMKKSHKGKHHITEEHKEKMRKAKQSTTLSSEAREKIRQANVGKFVSSETREKIRQSKLGKKRKPFTEEHKEKIRQANIGKHH